MASPVAKLAAVAVSCLTELKLRSLVAGEARIATIAPMLVTQLAS